LRKVILLALAALAVPALAQSSSAPFTVQESGESFGRLQQAVDAIGDGEGTIVIAPGRYGDCAVQERASISYVAAEGGTAIFDGGICEGKATLVLRGRRAEIQGLTFQNLRVPDGNGAGIRIEHGDLVISESLFRNSEEGILGGDDEGADIRIERSTFSGLGRCDRDLDCAHSIYIGNYRGLYVTHSRFERGAGGHYVKSRAARTDVLDSSFDDTAGRATNYMIDLPNGGTGTIARNMFVQGKDKENYSAFIMNAAEGPWRKSTGLAVTDNDASIAPGVVRGTSFVADMSGDALRIENNRLGKGIARFEKR